MINQIFVLKKKYGGILLPHNYVNMQLIYVNIQYYHADKQHDFVSVQDNCYHVT